MLLFIAIIVLAAGFFGWYLNKDLPKSKGAAQSKQVTPPAPAAPPLISALSANPLDMHKITDLRHFKDYIVLDTETTGLSPKKDRIIDIGIVEVSDRAQVDTFSTMVNPGISIPAAASAVNHIYNSDVKTAPSFVSVAHSVSWRVNKKVVVGYNVKFDLDFLGYEFARAGVSASVSYVDVLPLARRAFPGLANYKLETVATYLHLIGRGQEHRALSDAQLTAKVLVACIDEILAAHDKSRQDSKERRAAADAERREKYAASPLLDKTFCFTGDFSSGRENLENMVGTVGGLLREKVSTKLNYLVVGDISGLPDWAVERKYKKADELIAAGQRIKKITEADFLQMVGAALGSIRA